MIILISGLPGSGKTYFAKALSNRLKISHVNTDTMRKKMSMRGKYRADQKSNVYQALLGNVEELLNENKSVIVDATFSKHSNRTLFENLALKEHTILKYIEIVASEDCIRERLKTPRMDSEADFEVYKEIRKNYESFENEHLDLHSDELSIEEMIDKSIQYLQLPD